MIMPFNVTSPPHLHCRFDFGWRFDLFSSPQHYGIAHGHILRAPSCTSKWKTAFRNIPRFDSDTTSLWWKTQTSRGVCSSKSQTPLSLVLSYFSKLSHPGDFAASQPRFWWWIWNRLWRLLQNWWHFYLCMVFSSRRWTLSLVAQTDSSITS